MENIVKVIHCYRYRFRRTFFTSTRGNGSLKLLKFSSTNTQSVFYTPTRKMIPNLCFFLVSTLSTHRNKKHRPVCKLHIYLTPSRLVPINIYRAGSRDKKWPDLCSHAATVWQRRPFSSCDWKKTTQQGKIFMQFAYQTLDSRMNFNGHIRGLRSVFIEIDDCKSTRVNSKTFVKNLVPKPRSEDSGNSQQTVH